MLERLLELFFHAKSGIFAGIFLIGTTGALVTATVSNGVTTITITQASASPSASASASPSASTSPSASPSHSPSASPSTSPSASPSGSPASAPSEGSASAGTCSDQAHAAADAVQTVNSAFSGFHTDLMHLRADAKAAKAIVEQADKDLKEIRQSAVKAIHATNTCASGKDDDDKDQDEDNNDDHDRSSHESNFVVVLISNIQSFFGNHTQTVNNTTTTNTTFTGGPKDIADQAVAAMQQVFDDANAQLSELASPSPRATRSPKPSAHVDTHKTRDHGKGGRGDREGDDD